MNQQTGVDLTPLTNAAIAGLGKLALCMLLFLVGYAPIALGLKGKVGSGPRHILGLALGASLALGGLWMAFVKAAP